MRLQSHLFDPSDPDQNKWSSYRAQKEVSITSKLFHCTLWDCSNRIEIINAFFQVLKNLPLRDFHFQMIWITRVHVQGTISRLVFGSLWEWCWWCWSAAQCCDVNLIEETDHQDSWDSCEMPAAHQWRVVNAKPSPNWASPGQGRTSQLGMGIPIMPLPMPPHKYKAYTGQILYLYRGSQWGMGISIHMPLFMALHKYSDIPWFGIRVIPQENMYNTPSGHRQLNFVPLFQLPSLLLCLAKLVALHFTSVID